MSRSFRLSLLAAAALLLPGCVREANIAMPSHLAAQTEPVRIAGLGGWHRGHFRMGASEGRFTREALSANSFGFLVDAGGGQVDIEGPEVDGRLVAHCGYRQTALDGGAVTVTHERLSYECVFDRNGQLEGGLRLAEVTRGRGLLAGVTRTGVLQFGELTLGIRAIHEAEGGGLPTGTPLGYAFDLDGRQIGAIDLNGTDRLVHAPVAAGRERQAVLMASLALAIFRDPGD